MKVVASSLVGVLLLLWSNRSSAGPSEDPLSSDRPFELLGLVPGPLDGAAGGPPTSSTNSSSLDSDLQQLPINTTNCGGSSSSNATNRKRLKGSTSLQGALRSRSVGPGSSLLSHSPSPPSETAIERSNSSLCQDAQPEQSAEESAYTAVAKETAVTQAPSTTFRLELDLLATANKAKIMGVQLRQALQSQVAPILTSCEDNSRRLVEGPSNVVFGTLSVDDLRECPDPSGARSAATCLTATGMVSVYGTANGFAAALSSAATSTDVLQVDGLIDIFFCRVVNATDEAPVPEGANFNNASTSTVNPTAPTATAPTDSLGSDSSSSGGSTLPPVAYIGVSLAILLVVCVILLAIRRRQASGSQVKESAKDDDGNDTDSSSEFATENMKINGFASVSRGYREDDEETSYASRTIEERIIDEEYDSEGGEDEDDDNVVIVPIYRFVTALKINPTEDEQSLRT